jgi:ABC-type amino acid transport substrate-binding protein
MPPARAYLAFENNLFDCVFPVNNSILALNKSLLLSEPLGVASAYIYTLKSRPVIKSVQSLNNMILGVRRGFDYGGFKFPHSTKTVTVGTIEQNLQLLRLNRVDAFVAYEPDSLVILDNYPKIEVHRDDDFSIYVQKDRIACYDTPRNHIYINNINEQLRILNIH